MLGQTEHTSGRRDLEAPGNDAGYGVSDGCSGNVIATGYFMGSVDFGGGTLTSGGISMCSCVMLVSIR